jgi:hypothetical protein
MRFATSWLFIICFSMLLLGCAEKNATSLNSVFSLKIIEAYIQEEIPGQENQASKWVFSIQVAIGTELESLVFGNETYPLKKNGVKYSVVLKNKFYSEKDIPEKHYLKYWHNGKLKTVNLPNIKLKEALYLP